jgi:hypothetical protein
MIEVFTISGALCMWIQEIPLDEVAQGFLALASQLPSTSTEHDEAALENSTPSADLQDPDSGLEKELLASCSSLEL